ncbi:L,D-transpeptidase [Candidatus Parcubacteria bacterium]|nr:L,D-transpeptidase [Patescibacteria group bacterium]MCG2693732.1 L,D-transpeptidase [Candidatus Parcubacteria bacterium]
MLKTLLALFCVLSNSSAYANTNKNQKIPYSDTAGYKLCQEKAFDCLIVKEKTIEQKYGKKVIRKAIPETWEELFPNENHRILIMKVNRLNIPLKKGMPIAVPKDKNKTLTDFSPFLSWIKPPGEKILIFNPKLLAWAAYLQNGKLLRWGPALGGMDRCPDTWRKCRTLIGVWRIIKKGDADSHSHIYPIGCGRKDNPCAPMPWFIQFEKHGYGFHGSHKMVGKHASHGCVRTFTDDAKWLNQNFVEIGTKTITLPY